MLHLQALHRTEEGLVRMCAEIARWTRTGLRARVVLADQAKILREEAEENNLGKACEVVA